VAKNLLRANDVDAMKEFMDAVANSKRGGIPKEVLEKRMIIAHEDTEGEEGAWLPWNEVAKKEGHDALLEMISAGTVLCRRHIHLPLNSKIVYPFNQQVAYVKEGWSKQKKRSERESFNDTAAAGADDVAKFHRRWSESSPAKAPAKAPPQGPAPSPADKGGTERDKVAIGNLRKTHSAWDRARREYTALVAKSKDHQNTSGCKLETDLGDAVTTGTNLDSKLLTYETKFLEGKAFTDAEIGSIAATVGQLVDIMKTNNKRAAAMKPWFKLED